MKTDWMQEHTPASYENRYWLFDVDGATVGYGYNQRPAAIRNAERFGCGVWDCREHRLVIPVDVDKRIAQHKSNRESALRKADEAFERLHRCQEAIRTGKVAG